jgi:hypothetical protein
MAIRFFCAQCHAPLEVDDADAGRQVLCYHCRTKNTAPAQSDPALVGDNLVLPAPQALPPAKPVTLGVLGLIAALALLAGLVVASLWINTNVRDPLVRNPKFLALPPAKQKEFFNAKMVELREKNKAKVVGALVAWVLLALVALAFSLVAVATRRGFGYAVTGLVITVLILFFLLYSMHIASRPPPAQTTTGPSSAVKEPRP